MIITHLHYSVERIFKLFVLHLLVHLDHLKDLPSRLPMSIQIYIYVFL